jgi:TatD DNase family protein
MIDTHAHIRNEGEIEIEGLKWVVLSGANIGDSLKNLELAIVNPKLKPAVGIHPMDLTTKFNIDEAINHLDKLCQDNKNIVAIGECGLEFTDEGVDKQKQEILFRGQIALSLKHQKPLIVHSREAAEETLEILKSYKNLQGVIHCYTGGKKRIKRYLEISDNWYFGIDGNLTYEDGLGEVVKNIPKDRLVLETDSPELTPVPFRGEKNKPEYVKFIYQKLAEIWGLSFAETEKIVDENADRLFNKIGNNIF